MGGLYMEKVELQTRAFVAPAETVVVSAYDETGKADACTLAFLCPAATCRHALLLPLTPRCSARL